MAHCAYSISKNKAQGNLLLYDLNQTWAKVYVIFKRRPLQLMYFDRLYHNFFISSTTSAADLEGKKLAKMFIIKGA